MTLPCSLCGEPGEAGAVECPVCFGDPQAAYEPCPDCTDGYVFHEAEYPGQPEERACPTCNGERRIEAFYAIAREQALQTGRAA